MSKKQTSKKPVGDIDLKGLEQVLDLMAKHQVAELGWESGGTKIHLKTQMGVAASQFAHHAPTHTFIQAPAPQAPAAASASAAQAQTASKPAAKQNENLKQVLSPFVGTFYRASSPAAAPYVKEGQMVKPGDTLCIVEAMKLMNEIECEFSGKIVSILVENGQPVEFDEPLFMIET